MKMLNHNNVCRRNRTESGVLLDVVNQSTPYLLSKNHKVSRLTFKCNFRKPSKKSRILPAPIFTKLVTAQQNCVHISHKVFQPNRKIFLETADRYPFIPLNKIQSVSFKYNQQDATLYNILYYCQCSTCFRRFLRPSSGAQELYTQHLVCAKLACCYR